jgi:soluble lytic murein transglycosylase
MKLLVAKHPLSVRCGTFGALGALGAVAALVVATASCQERAAQLPQTASLEAQKAQGAGAVEGGVDATKNEIKSVLGDPRFLDAKKLHDAHDFKSEAAALTAALAKGTLTPDETCAVSYAAGRAYVLAEDSAGAIRSFDAASADACPLAPYAKIRGAQARARSSGADDALLHVESVDAPLLAGEKSLVIADCKWEKGAHAEAAPLFRAWLSKNAHGQRWVDVSLKLAATDLEAAAPGGAATSDEERGERANEAFDLATKVMCEAPKLEADKATDLRGRAAAAAKKSPALSAEERVKRARGYLDATENAKAIEEARAASADPHARPEDKCRAEIVRANAEHGKPAVADAWSDAVKKCEGVDEELVTTLYNAAKAASGAKRYKDAIDKFARIEDKYPAHRLADDARFRAALAYKAMGDASQYETFMMSIADKYPSGDMGDEGLFLAALIHLDKADDTGAKMMLDKIVDREAHAAEAPGGAPNRSWATGGRASYFRARISERAGETTDAKKRYADVVTGVPLGYYAWLARARLGALDRDLADKTLRDAEDRDEKDVGPLLADGVPPEHAKARADALLLARRFLAVGEVDLAKRALWQAGGETPLAEKVQIARMFDDAQKWDDGIAFSRGKTSDFYAHYPKGKWRDAWEAAYPRAFEDEVVTASGTNGIPAMLTWAIMREESSFMPEVKSSANAYGLMQLIVPTAKLVAQGTTLGSDEASLKRADVSIALGTKLLAQLRSSLSHPLFAIAAYNGGAGAVKKWLADNPTKDIDLFVEEIPWDETRNYVKRVTMSELVYGYLYDRKAFGDIEATPLVIQR